jgi:hypothetical protein
MLMGIDCANLLFAAAAALESAVVEKATNEIRQSRMAGQGWKWEECVAVSTASRNFVTLA